MDDLVTWLRAQLDEDERIANEAIDQGGRGRQGEAHWTVASPEDMPGLIGDQAGNVVTLNGEATAGWSPSRFQAEHIARHDPARVLREAEAQRRILDRLEPFAAFDMPPAKAQAASREEWYVVTAARDAIKLLALPYADRPGYRAEWAPTS